MSRASNALLLLLPIFWMCSSPVAAQQNSGADDNNTLIKATPSHIMLGSLPYGSKDNSILTRDLTLQGFLQGTSLTNIDLSHAEGIQILGRRDLPGGEVLTLAINVRQFSKDQSYGKFIKKIIRLETNSSEQPQLVIPVIGWLGVNETSRDFNSFVFNGSERWQGWWGTPNMAGSVLAPLILFLIGGIAWIRTAQTRGLRWLNIGIISLLLIDATSLLIFLAFTYSRGAWIAFMVGCLVMICYPGQLRRQAALALVAFCLILVFLPSGLKRVGSYTHIEADLSVSNRLKLWTGALQMMAEHPLTGIGSDQFGATFERDYQLFDHTAENSTAVSDYFTFGAERGLLLLGIGLGMLLFFVSESFRDSIQNKNVFQMTLTATLVTVLVASAFSTLWFVREFEWIFEAALLGLLVYLAGQAYRSRNWKSHWTSFLIRMSKSISATLIILGLISLASLCFLPTKTHDFTSQLPDHETVSWHVVEPRWKPSKGVVVYFSDTDEDTALLYHSTLRPLAALGWQVVWTPVVSDQTQAETFIASLSRTFQSRKLFVAGDGQGGRMAWLVVTAMPEKVSAGAGYGFLSSDLDPKAGANPMRNPFLVVHSLYDDHVSANTTIRASQKNAFITVPLIVILTPNEPSRFSMDWPQWLRAIDIFLGSLIESKEPQSKLRGI